MPARRKSKSSRSKSPCRVRTSRRVTQRRSPKRRTYKGTDTRLYGMHTSSTPPGSSAKQNWNRVKSWVSEKKKLGKLIHEFAVAGRATETALWTDAVLLTGHEFEEKYTGMNVTDQTWMFFFHGTPLVCGSTRPIQLSPLTTVQKLIVLSELTRCDDAKDIFSGEQGQKWMSYNGKLNDLHPGSVKELISRTAILFPHTDYAAAFWFTSWLDPTGELGVLQTLAAVCALVFTPTLFLLGPTATLIEQGVQWGRRMMHYSSLDVAAMINDVSESNDDIMTKEFFKTLLEQLRDKNVVTY